MRGFSIAEARKLVFGGASSIVVAVAVTNVLRIFSSIVLTRLLDSEAYGIVGIVTSVAFVMAMLSDTGIIPYVIRHPEGHSKKLLDEVWTIRLVRGCLLTVVMFIAAGPIAQLIGKDYLMLAIMAWSINFFLDGISSLAGVTSVREGQLWRLSIVETVGNAATIVASIVAAALIHSYWAIIIGMLAGQSLRVVMSYMFFEKSFRRFRFSMLRSREIWQFSRNIAASSVLTLLILQTDKLVLAKMMSLTVFGLYSIATTLATAPEAIANPYCTRVLYPAFAAAVREAPDTLRTIFYSVRRNVSLLYAFGVGGLIGGAQLLVDVLYDPRYAAVAMYLQIVAIRVVLRLPNMVAYEAMVALGQTRPGLIANIARVVWLTVGTAIALWHGNAILMVVVVATDEVPATLYYWGVLRRNRLLRVREELLYFLMIGVGMAAGLAVLESARALFYS